MSFINDQEKMVDFFTITKEEFLDFYSYLTEEEYETTKRDVLSRSGYWNAESLIEDEDIDGTIIGKIVQSIMMTEWLQSKINKTEMKFNWDDFTKEHYDNYINGLFRIGEYVGSVRIGDICIDLIRDDTNVLTYDFYVAHEDTGYGYRYEDNNNNGNDVIPYDYADGGMINIADKPSYEEFKNKAEKLFIDYIENYSGGYSLKEHANRPLLIW